MGARSAEKVFLTGATGVLGAHILKTLLATTDSEIYCLVRAETPEQAYKRLDDLLSVYDPEADLTAEFQSRVKPVLGDVSSDQLGLSSDEYFALAAQIDVIIHGAAYTNLFARYTKIEPINVGGTRRMIEFALQTPSKKMTYVSTYTVMGDKTFDADCIFRETDLDIGQGFDHMTYQLSKFEAEKLIHAAGERGLVWNIVRPGQIYGESTTGRYPQGQTNVSGLFYDIFRTVIQTKVAIDSVTYFDITPVDYVSEATLYLTLREPTAFNTLHLTNPDRRTYTEVISLIKNLGYDIDFVTLEEYKRRVFERGLLVDGEIYRSATVAAFRWWFKRDVFDFRASCVIDCSKAVAMLEPRGITCPKIDTKLIGTYIERGIAHSYFPSAGRFAEIMVGSTL